MRRGYSSSRPVEDLDPPPVGRAPGSAPRRAEVCPHGDEWCPCPDGDPCHYTGPAPASCPTPGHCRATPTVAEMAATFDGPESVGWLRGQRDAP